MPTIKISEDLRKALVKRKVFKDDSYEDVIWGLLEEKMTLSEMANKSIEAARKNIKEGKSIPLSKIIKGLEDIKAGRVKKWK